jgi:hypothetical protein
MLESLILIEPRLIAAAAKARVADFSPTHRERERERERDFTYECALTFIQNKSFDLL